MCLWATNGFCLVLQNSSAVWGRIKDRPRPEEALVCLCLSSGGIYKTVTSSTMWITCFNYRTYFYLFYLVYLLYFYCSLVGWMRLKNNLLTTLQSQVLYLLPSWEDWLLCPSVTLAPSRSPCATRKPTILARLSAAICDSKRGTGDGNRWWYINSTALKWATSQ